MAANGTLPHWDKRNQGGTRSKYMTNASWPRKSPIPYMVSGAEPDRSPRSINEGSGQISIRKDLITPQEVYRTIILLVQGLTNCGLCAKRSPLPVFVNNTATQSYSIIYCCIYLLCAAGRDELLQQRPHGMQSQKYVHCLPLQMKFADPCANPSPKWSVASYSVNSTLGERKDLDIKKYPSI